MGAVNASSPGLGTSGHIGTNVDEARRILAASRRIVAFTGAGVSAESGIPTFRDAGGLWERVSPEEFGTPWGIADLVRRRPDRLVEVLAELAGVVLEAEPNPAHQTIGALERAGRLAGVVTQNVDDLHERGGTRTIRKLHGDLGRFRCLGCDRTDMRSREALAAIVRGLTATAALTADQLLAAAPRCPSCRALERPDVVLFGEMLPESEVEGARRLLADADCLLVVGTSGSVEPAASFARTVVRGGAPMIEINLAPTDLTPLATVSLFAPAGEILPELVTEG